MRFNSYFHNRNVLTLQINLNVLFYVCLITRMPLQLYTVPSDPLVPSIPGKACLSLCFRPVIDWLQPLSEPGLDKWPKKNRWMFNHLLN